MFINFIILCEYLFIFCIGTDRVLLPLDHVWYCTEPKMFVLNQTSPGQKFCRMSGQKWQLLITQLLIG